MLVLPTNWPEKVSDVAEREIDGVAAGGVVLLEPQPTNSANPTITANNRLRAAREEVLGFIAPPPASS